MPEKTQNPAAQAARGVLTVLGIESSCDETAAAVVRRSRTGRAQILSNVIRSQTEHQAYGGVVPELAARAHSLHLDRVIARAMQDARCDFPDLSAVAVAAGPGLIGGLIAGLVSAKALALAHNLPFCAVNHLEAHALSPGLCAPCPFPYLLLLVSGGHTLLASILAPGAVRLWGETRDDALGEAFDKTARLLDLPFPGGPWIERLAAQGDPGAFALPRPFAGRDHCDFSFAGLKSAVRREVEKARRAGRLEARRADLAASFQDAAAACLIERTTRAMRRHADLCPQKELRLAAAGGVAANRRIASGLEQLTAAQGWRFVAPPPALCTDNGAMIAWAGAAQLAQGRADSLTAPPRARWPLGEK